MGNWVTFLSVLIARLIIIGFFTFIYVTPLFMLFYLIIFHDVELSHEIMVKFYEIAYLVGLVLMYVMMMKDDKKDQKPVNKGV